MTSTPLFGLILAGGASTRMQRDKAALTYHGRTQLEWAFALLAPLCGETFVSVREAQRTDPVRSRFPLLVDGTVGEGPIAGICTALTSYPNVAWLVLACDLPFLTATTLKHLIAHRDPSRIATAYRSQHDGLPEPLCAIWEPRARDAVLAHINSGKHCPRKLLINSNAALLEIPEANALDNVNTPDELSAAKAMLSGRSPATGEPKSIRVQYFAVLREQAGRREEQMETRAQTAADLYAELKQRYGFQLSPTQLKVALNNEFSDWQTPLKQGDAVVFIPPVAGG
ncbi:MAG TPA: MoaD family protein [Steroidobacteraceae bacterium]|nr:MoaD family protein [Steroidobacteraceae bacterium]